MARKVKAPKRPRTHNEQLVLRVSADLLRRLGREARALKCTRSEAARRCIEAWLNAADVRKAQPEQADKVEVVQ